MILRIRIQLFAAVALSALLLCASTSQAQQAAAGAQPTRAITGRVINSSGEPLAGGFVYASPLSNTRAPQSVRVGNDGTFKIDGLDAGPYRVWSSVPGYVSAFQPPSLDATNFYRAGDSLTLTLVKGGVITGTVRGPNGPLVAVGVYALRVRDEQGKRLRVTGAMRERATDDRGVYRIYSLPPGSYLVRVARPRIGLIAPSPYDSDVATYFPSSTRDGAAEVLVREGEEITADIQHRGDVGYAINGSVSGVSENQQQFRANVTITLTDGRDGTEIGSVSTSTYDNFSFALSGIPDGEYELTAFQFLQTREGLRSRPRHLTVRGNDVTDVTLTLASQASIEGRLVFESDPKAGCGKRRDTAAEDTIVFARRYEPEKTKATERKATLSLEVSVAATNLVLLAVGDAKSTFTLRNLPAGSYRLEPRAPGGGWYVRSIAIGQPVNPSARTSLAGTKGISVRAGEKVSGVTVTFTEGAAVVRGKVAAAEGQSLPPSRVYLVPAEKDNASNLLRYFEAPVADDGSFAIGNVAPGEYFIVALNSETDAQTSSTIRAETNWRNAVIRDAEKSKQSVTLKPCQRIDNYELPLSVIAKP